MADYWSKCQLEKNTLPAEAKISKHLADGLVFIPYPADHKVTQRSERKLYLH